MRGPLLLLLFLGLPAALAWTAQAPAHDSIAPEGLLFLRGDLHAHTCYSDGEGTPADAFRTVKASGQLDFFAVTDHAEALLIPFCAHEECLTDPLACHAAPAPPSTEWDDILAQAEAFTDASFVALRGFEWSSPVEGHVNVIGSAQFVEWVRTGPAPMLPMYAWLALPPGVGGSDGVASFNHPDSQSNALGTGYLRFDNFTHVPLAEPEMQLLEVYNSGRLHEAGYVQALDEGWHVGATGVTDGHGFGGWLSVHRGRTTVLAPERTRAAILGALDAMRTYATNDADLEVVFSAAGQLMGSTVDVPDTFEARVQVRDPTPGDGLARVLVLTHGGALAASFEAGGAQSVDWQAVLHQRPGAAETWFFVKVEERDGDSAHTAPIWAR